MIAVGAEAFCLIHTKPTPSGRRELLGAARVRVEAIDGGGSAIVRIVAGSGVPAGHRYSIAVGALFAADDREARAAFFLEVDRFWSAA